jgi:lipoprotein-anchoring transpeptidase ErfK/SrfK
LADTQKADLHQKLGSLSFLERVNKAQPKPKRSRDLSSITPFMVLPVVATIPLLIALFFTVAHGSLAHINVGNIPIKADDSQTGLEKQIVQAANTYKLKIQYADGSTKSYPLAATGIAVNAKTSAANTRQALRHTYLGRLEWWRPIRLSLNIQTNPYKLQSFVTESATQVKVAPIDAALTLAGGSAVISEAKVGNGSGLTNASVTVADAVSDLSPSALVLRPMTLKPAITTADLIKSKAKAQGLLDNPVVFMIAGHTVKASPADVAGWVDISPVPAAKTADVTVNSGKVLEYINAVAKRYVAVPRSRVIANTSEGEVVLDAGSDGVDVVNKDQTASSVAQQLQKNQAINIALEVKYTPAKTVEAQAYDKWFVADVTNKRMYAYEGTTLVHSFLISAGAPATPTVIGTYRIYAKYASQDMTGNNADGSRYFQPAVPYVNYFTGGYAIHGNYWRPASYFGNINSSHGCIGINVDDAAWIYDWAPIGTPVITHT